MESEDIFPTVDEISKNFDKALEVCFKYDELLNDSVQKYSETIGILKKIEKSIIMHGLFSPNEELDELLPETLKYLLLPFYVGDVFGRVTENRRAVLEMSQKYLNEFLKLVDHYTLLDKDLKSQWKMINENPKYEPTRDERIKGFKEKKRLENQYKALENNDDDKSKREILVTLIMINVHKAIGQLKLISSEFEILTYKEKLESDKQTKEDYEKLCAAPKPKLKYHHIPKPEVQDQPYLINNMKPLCHNCDSLKILEYRQKLEKQVWQPGFAQPTMTLDEFADGEFKMFQEMEAKNKAANEKNKLEAEEDSDKDELNEKKTKKDRDWDDWKDEHEKGGGNRMGK